MLLLRWIGIGALLSACAEVAVEPLEVGPRPEFVQAGPDRGAERPEDPRPPSSPPVDLDADDTTAPAAADPQEAPEPQVDGAFAAEDAAAPPPSAPWGPAPVLVASGLQANLRSFNRRGQALGEVGLAGVARGLRHDRRRKDGYWVLLEADPGVVLVKLDWSGRELRRLSPDRKELREARRLRGLDYVFGHQASADLLLLLYDNVRGLPVVEGISVATGETRFATRFSAGNFAGLRAETYRHGPSQSLILLEWWVARDGQSLELWRYDRGFLSRRDQRPLPVPVVGFDLPPWRELWGAAEAAMVRVQPDGVPGPVVPTPGWSPGAISIDE